MSDNTPLAQLRRLAGEGDLEGTIGCNCYTCRLVRGGYTKAAHALLVALTDPWFQDRVHRMVEEAMWSPASGPVTWTEEKIDATLAQASLLADGILNLLATAALKGDADVG